MPRRPAGERRSRSNLRAATAISAHGGRGYQLGRPSVRSFVRPSRKQSRRVAARIAAALVAVAPLLKRSRVHTNRAINEHRSQRSTGTPRLRWWPTTTATNSGQCNDRRRRQRRRSSNIMELTKVCRLCLAAADWPVDVFDELADKIAQCLQLRISRTDQLPKHVCVKCKDTVNDFHAYYTNTVECQKQLDQLVDVQQNMVSRRRRNGIDGTVVTRRTSMPCKGDSSKSDAPSLVRTS